MKYIEITTFNFDGLLKDLRQILWYVTTHNLVFIKWSCNMWAFTTFMNLVFHNKLNDFAVISMTF
jgi:hypothetical protein